MFRLMLALILETYEHGAGGDDLLLDEIAAEMERRGGLSGTALDISDAFAKVVGALSGALEGSEPGATVRLIRELVGRAGSSE